jgi:hypothetical protein
VWHWGEDERVLALIPAVHAAHHRHGRPCLINTEERLKFERPTQNELERQEIGVEVLPTRWRTVAGVHNQKPLGCRARSNEIVGMASLQPDMAVIGPARSPAIATFNDLASGEIALKWAPCAGHLAGDAPHPQARFPSLVLDRPVARLGVVV